MTLIPTNCWKAARPIPTHTTGAIRLVPGITRSDRRGRCSPLRLCSTCRTSPLASPPMRAKIRRACSLLPRKIRKRGDSGMNRTPSRNATAGTASIQNIQRQAGACSPGAEGVRQGVHGAVDHAAVETEEKAADRGHRAQHDYIGRANRDGFEGRRSARRRRYAPGQVSLDTFYWFIHSKVFFQQGLGTPRSKVDPSLEAEHDCV